jgi:hypothetical protein
MSGKSDKRSRRGSPNSSPALVTHHAQVNSAQQRSPQAAVVEQLARFFHRNGYVRRQSAERLARDRERYKKGDEVRLTAMNKNELAVIRRLLKAAGFKPGSPYRKNSRYQQPVYGKQAVRDFLSLVGERGDG